MQHNMMKKSEAEPTEALAWNNYMSGESMM